MKKSSLIVIIVIAVLAIIVLYMAQVYNALAVGQESVETKWSNVESQYQRRSDLIPNLVNTVKGYAAHEENTLTAVVDARAKATQTTLDVNHLTPETLEAYQAAQAQVGGAIGRLLMVAESYPDLKASDNFKDLQKQLEGTENRIQEARSNYNLAAQAYNTKIRKFPSNMVASMFGFEKMPYFKSEQGSEKAPEVSF